MFLFVGFFTPAPTGFYVIDDHEEPKKKSFKDTRRISKNLE